MAEQFLLDNSAHILLNSVENWPSCYT